MGSMNDSSRSRLRPLLLLVGSLTFLVIVVAIIRSRRGSSDDVSQHDEPSLAPRREPARTDGEPSQPRHASSSHGASGDDSAAEGQRREPVRSESGEGTGGSAASTDHTTGADKAAQNHDR